MFSALETRGFQRRAAQLGGATDLVWVAASAAGPGLTVVAGLIVGLYEVLAPAVGWWKYEPARSSLWGLALYIPVGEALMFLPILPLAAAAVAEEDRPCSAAVCGGAIFALCIAAGYGLAYLVLEVI